MFIILDAYYLRVSYKVEDAYVGLDIPLHINFMYFFISFQKKNHIYLAFPL